MAAFPAPLLVRISDLAFRAFRGEIDFPAMVEIMNATARADRLEYNEKVDDIARLFANLANCDPHEDMIFAEAAGRPIAFGRVFWRDEITGLRLYTSLGFIDPASGAGPGTAMLARNQARLAEIAATHSPEIEKTDNAYAVDTSPGVVTLLERNGYAMARAEAHADHLGFIPPAEGDYERWLHERRFQPHLWKVARDGGEVAGAVLTMSTSSGTRGPGERQATRRTSSYADRGGDAASPAPCSPRASSCSARWAWRRPCSASILRIPTEPITCTPMWDTAR